MSERRKESDNSMGVIYSHDLKICHKEQRKRRGLLSGLSKEKPPVRLWK
jgi:hypothetical protein